MDQRMRFLVACRDTDEAFAAICREFGVSRKTGYKWLERYDTLGVAGLVDQPRVAEAHPRWLTDAAVDAIIEARKDHPHWGPKKLQVLLCKSRPELARVGVSTIAGVLKRFGLVRARRRRPSVPRYSEPLDACVSPTPLLAGEPVGARWIEDGKWELRYGPIVLGVIDERRKEPRLVASD